jgi:uncharacterized protein
MTAVRSGAPVSSRTSPGSGVVAASDGGADPLTAGLRAAGVVVLHNEVAQVPHDAGGSSALHVVGIAPTRPALADVEAALADLSPDAARVVMMHSPTVFPRLPAGAAPLAVAGHTHCGQVALPGSPRWSSVMLTEEEKVVVDGFAPAGYGAEGNTHFVTCGVGFTLVPVRINAPPQLVFFTLRAVA